MFDAPNDSLRFQNPLNLLGQVTTGILEHTLLFGYDYFHEESGNIRDGICCPDFSINIFNHTFLTEQPAFGPADGFQQTRKSREWHGAYFQDQVKLPFNLHAMGGVRYDTASSRNTISNQSTEQEDRFSPRGGLLWQPMSWLSIYGSYTQNFGVSNGINSDGNALPPQTAHQWEIGLKTELFGGCLRSTFSYFELTKQNISVPDLTNLRFRRAAGEAESRGFEVDVTGEVSPSLNMIALYSYLPFSDVTKDVGSSGVPGDTGNQGNRLFLAAKHSGSFWTTCAFQNESLRGFKVGGGVRGISKRQGNLGNAYQLPTFVIGNLMASYQYRVGKMRLTAQLNVNNVSNEKYYAGTSGFFYIMPGAPRTVFGSLRIDY